MLRWIHEQLDLREQQKRADYANHAAVLSIEEAQHVQQNYLAVQIADMMLETKEAQANGNLMEHLDKIGALGRKYGEQKRAHLNGCLMWVVVDRAGDLNGVTQPTFPSSLGDK